MKSKSPPKPIPSVQSFFSDSSETPEVFGAFGLVSSHRKATKDGSNNRCGWGRGAVTGQSSLRPEKNKNKRYPSRPVF